MPRRPDPTLRSRIAEAALALWRKGGDPAVTIRDVAARAATTTPSVYAQFSDRAGILAAARQLAYAAFTAELSQAASALDACARILAFADAQPRDYDLLFGTGFRDRVGAGVLAAEFGKFEDAVKRSGVADPYARPIAFALRNLVHGTAMFRLAHLKAGPWWPESRRACLEACALLLDERRRS